MTRTLLIGAAGTVGTALAPLLAARGHEVLAATSRVPTAPNQVQVDLASGAGLADAFGQAQQAFIFSPPGFARQDEVLLPQIEAARSRGLRKVVLMSAMGANADEALPLRRAERALEQSGLAYNIIRPNWFMQNFNSFWLHGIREHGVIALPVGASKTSFIDARDIAAVAAELLTRGDLDNRDFDLTGPAALSHGEVAAILSCETGRAIRFQNITPEAMLAGLLEAGLPRDYAAFLVTILGFVRAGYNERTTDAVAAITGRAPGGFEQYARDQRAAWLA